MSNELLAGRTPEKILQDPRRLLCTPWTTSALRWTQGKTLGVVGESGCGKSTLGRAILGLNEATDGKVLFEGRGHHPPEGRRQPQGPIRICRSSSRIPSPLWIPESPSAIRSPIPCSINHAYKDKDELKKRVSELMDTVGLARRLTYSYPHELDGGRRQRIGVARALALNPKFIVCDEPVSALDVSIQAQILNLLQDLQEERGLTYMFITHDLSVVKHISDDIMVMYVGCVVEKSPSKALFEKPLHPYTKGLLSAIPIPVINRDKKRVIMKGEISSPIDPKPGCRFATRCPFATDICHQQQPALEEVQPGHFAACHRVREINDL